jgi:phosphate transport system substrate-binding protein
MKRILLLVSVLFALSVAAQSQNIKVKGSAELLPVVDRWASNYSKAHPGTNVVSLGGGTSVGISSLADGSADIATAERALTESEVKALRSPIDVVFATDALVFVVHPTNPVRQITMDQLRDIYTGKITNWLELGGANLPIHPMAIGTNFGMTSLVHEKVLKGANWGPNVRIARSEHDLLYTVWQDPSAISYSGMALGKEFKHLAIAKEKGAQAYGATTENILAGHYTLIHPVHLYLTDRATPAAREFASWTLSHEGQQFVAASGIWVLNNAERDRSRSKLKQ